MTAKGKVARKRKRRSAEKVRPGHPTIPEMLTGIVVVGGVTAATAAAVAATPLGAPIFAAGTALAAKHPMAKRMVEALAHRGIEEVAGEIGKAIFQRFR